MLNGGESFRFDIRNIFCKNLVYHFVEICILLDELRCEAIKETEQIMRHKHLPITTCASANANGGNGNLLGDSFRQSRRHRLKHEAEGARIFEDLCILKQTFRRRRSFALRAESAQLMDGLRWESQMSHAGDD